MPVWTRECVFCEREYVGTSRLVNFDIDMPCCEECLDDLVQVHLAIDYPETFRERGKFAKRFLDRIKNKETIPPAITKCPECKNIAPLKEGRVGFHERRRGFVCFYSGGKAK